MWSLLSRLLRLVTFCSSWWWSGDGLVVEKNMGPQHLVDGGSSVWYSTSEAQIQPAARDLGCGAVTTAKMPQIGGGVEMLRSWCYRAAKLPDRSRNDGCTQQGDLVQFLNQWKCNKNSKPNLRGLVDTYKSKSVVGQLRSMKWNLTFSSCCSERTAQVIWL